MPDHPAADSPCILTVGHSTRSAEEFLALLQAYNIQLLVDVRKMPGSRRHPHFNDDALEKTLEGVSIAYIHMPGLGGLRRRIPNSPNAGWKNASFQGYADYMLTPEFQDNLSQLITEARTRRTAIMCAEAVPWQCHRSLIADALVVREIPVIHILSPTRSQPHSLKPWAHVDGTRITYPSQEMEQSEFLGE